jgi:signal transduction histidine kinase/CheY-like chemotaxis protein
VRAEGSGRDGKRWLPLVATGVLILATVSAAVATNGFVEDQEHRLLEQRASESASFLSSLLEEQTAALPLTTVVLALLPGNDAAVLDLLPIPDDAPVAIGTADRTPDGLRVAAAVGGDLAAGDRLDGARAAVAEEALGTTEITSGVFLEDDRRVLVFAHAIGEDGARVLFQELALDPTTFEDTGDSEAFSDLAGAVYAADEVDEDHLVLATTGDLPIRGDDVVRRTVEIGASEWLLVVRAREPLVGTFAANAGWYVLLAGLLVSALMGILLEVVNRRRTYALRLVDERTAELREAREVADAANLSKSEFLSRMSHELRTPLNAVIGFGQLLREEDIGAENRDSVEQILRGGRHLLDLINEVLDITRIETGSFQFSPEPVLVSEVLGDVANLTAPLAAAAGVELVGPPEGCDVHVLADRQRLNQVLLNLVSNAIKYNRQGGTVSLACRPVDAGLRIEVSDTGAGIRPEQLALVFTPFERLGAEQTGIEGTGIGLALSRRLAEAMGGRLDVDSEVGVGSTFWTELPVVEGPLERFDRLHADDEPPGPDPAAPVRTILYIEDNLANLRLVERVLAHDPTISLVSAGQGSLGIALAREHQPALVLLDLHLPDTTGEEVLRRLRADPATASIPIVIISADATEGQIRRLIDAGAQAYITKPLDVGELRRTVDRHRTPTP